MKMFAAELLTILCLTGIASGYKSSNDTNICCDGTVADISMDCCGSEAFDPKKMFCCNDRLIPKPKDQETDEFKCCIGKQSTEIYNTRTSVCCGGVITKTPLGINAKNQYSCCDDPVTNLSQPYISSISGCCQGVISEKKYVGGDSVCCGKELITKPPRRFYWEFLENFLNADSNLLSCCGDIHVYSQRNQECRVLYNKTAGENMYRILNMTENSAVCGLEVYNVTTHWCCKDKIIPQPETNLSCCHVDSSAYDPRTQFCNETGVNNLDQAIINMYKKYIDQCGPSFPSEIPYSPPTELDNFVYSTFNSTHVCCNSAVGINPNRCCGTKIHDPSITICCDDVILDMPQGYDRRNYGCCPSSDGKSSSVFDISTSLCCQGKVYNATSDSYDCCYNSDSTKAAVYNKISSICCDGNVFVKEDPTKYYSCCGDQPWDKNFDYGYISDFYFPYGTDEELCCGEKTKYNPKTQICAVSLAQYKVLDKQNNRSSSCGLNLFDTQTEGCCNENVYTLTPFSECCFAARAAYDIRTKSCNGSTISDLDSGTVDGIAKCGSSFLPIRNPPMSIYPIGWPFWRPFF